MMTFEEMTEVVQRDEIMTGVNSSLGYFLLLFIDFYRRSKGNCFAGGKKIAVHDKCIYLYMCVCTVHESHRFRANKL